MILYNTIVGLAAGVALILVAYLLKKLANRERVQPEGFALIFGMTGFILSMLGITVSVMWPYTQLLHANIMFGEPALAFGVSLAAASFFLWRERQVFDELGSCDAKSGEGFAYIAAVLRPFSAWIFATGLIMASLTAAILFYQIGHAPPQEPISGRFSRSSVEPIFLGLALGPYRARSPAVPGWRSEMESQAVDGCHHLLERGWRAVPTLQRHELLYPHRPAHEHVRLVLEIHDCTSSIGRFKCLDGLE